MLTNARVPTTTVIKVLHAPMLLAHLHASVVQGTPAMAITVKVSTECGFPFGQLCSLNTSHICANFCDELRKGLDPSNWAFPAYPLWEYMFVILYRSVNFLWSKFNFEIVPCYVSVVKFMTSTLATSKEQLSCTVWIWLHWYQHYNLNLNQA